MGIDSSGLRPVWRRGGQVILLLCLGTVWVSAVPEREVLARESAEAWLVHLDRGDYAKALAEAAAPLRASLSPDEWVSGLEQVRRPLGKVRDRELKRLFFTVELPDGPVGEYVVVNFVTRFAGSEAAVQEILVMAPEALADGTRRWRVIGFYLD